MRWGAHATGPWGTPSSQLSLHESHRVFQNVPPTSSGEAWLTMPMTGPSSHERSTSDTNGVGQGVPRDNRTPALSHRMKHDKSILALAVSSQYIFAGTQGGEILVSGGEVARELSVLTLSRSTVSTPTSADESSRRTKEAYLACACRRTRSGSSRVRQTRLSM